MAKKNRNLIRSIVGEASFNIKSRYLGSRLGMAWLALNPLLMGGIYTFIMAAVFKMKLSPTSSNLDYAVYLLIGMACFNAFSEAVTLSANSITANASLVKNLVFPLEVLPVAAMFTGVVNLVISLIVALIVQCLSGNIPGWTLLLLPGWICLEYYFLSGICLFLSACNVYTRDVSQFITPVVTILMFASPVFYVESAVPETFRFIWRINPMYHLLEGYRAITMFHGWPSLFSVVFLLASGTLFLIAGLYIFMKAKPFFEEYL